MLNFIKTDLGEISISYENIPMIALNPGISDKCIPYARAERDTDKTVYYQEDNRACLELSLFSRANGHLCVGGNFSLDYKPYCINPILNAEIEIEGLFRQGFGIGGPTGYVGREKLASSSEGVTSFGLIALHFKQGFLVIYSDNHERYTCRFHIDVENRRKRSLLLTASFVVENSRDGDALPNLHFVFVKDLEQGLRRAAEEIAAPYSPDIRPPAYHWCSWYYCYNNFNMQQLEEVLDGLERLSPKAEVDTIQIDAGYCPSPGDWLEPFHTFPNGLQEAFRLIKSRGYKPGIWISPFMVGNRSNLYRKHPDWVLHTVSGEKIAPWRFYNEPKVWGAQDEEYYVLDTSNPDARAYILHVFAELKRMGAEFFKTDFMLWGMQESCEVARKTPGKTSVEYYREFMRDIRRVIGDSYWLGCISPFFPMLGFVNGMRIARDVGAKWEGKEFSPASLIREVTGDSYFNGVYWQNDPDAIMLRDYHIYLNETEIRSLAMLQAISGGIVYTSDFLHTLPKDRQELFRFMKPDMMRRPRIPFLDREGKVIAMHHRLDENRHIIFLFNQQDEDIMVSYSARELAGVERLYLCDYFGARCSDGAQSHIHGKLEAHGCLLLFCGEHTAPSDRIDNLWRWK